MVYLGTENKAESSKVHCIKGSPYADSIDGKGSLELSFVSKREYYMIRN
jgi:hypothetical protein